jgi:hypothetical protein
MKTGRIVQKKRRGPDRSASGKAFKLEAKSCHGIQHAWNLKCTRR